MYDSPLPPKRLFRHLPTAIPTIGIAMFARIPVRRFQCILRKGGARSLRNGKNRGARRF